MVGEDDEVYCVHPGGPRLTGLDQIRESWRQIFASGANVRIQLRSIQQMRGGLLAVHSLYEYIAVIGEHSATNVVAATNIYLNIGGGWRIVAHHASPVANAPAPQAVEPAPTRLH
jgi:ketosteroid isomerase-like protein